MILVTFRAVLFGELDPVSLDLIDGADLDAVLADDFHMLFDFRHVAPPGVHMPGTG
jgi:hypothetical protein